MAELADDPADVGADSGAGVGGCSLGHRRPTRVRGGWMCPRCGLRVVPLTAPECFEGHPQPTDIEPWTVWICPEDGEIVVPADISRDDVLDANLHHPLFQPRRAAPGLGEIRPFNVEDPAFSVWRGGPKPLGVVTFQPPETTPSHWPLRTFSQPPGPLPAEQASTPAQPRSSRSPTADPNDSLITVSAPVLAGFSLAAITFIGTSASLSGRPEALPALASFAAASVLLVFSIQMLALCSLPGLATSRKLRAVKASLYEFGLLAFLAGLGLFLWPQTWSAAAIAGLVVVGLAIVCDLALVGVAWCRRAQFGLPRTAP